MTTSATPATSAGEGTWASTTTPITVAVAGSSETISAFVVLGQTTTSIVQSSPVPARPLPVE